MNDSSSPASVVIVDDHPLMCDSIASAIGQSPALRVVGQAHTRSEAEDLIASTRPDIVLVDHQLPDGTGLDVIGSGVTTSPNSRFVMLTAHNEDEVLFEALRLGVHGYLLKNVGARGLIDSLERVAHGESLIDPAITGRVLQRIRNPKSDVDERIASLTDLERRVLELIAQGLTNKQIAPIIYVSDTSVKNYVSAVLRKLGLNRRTEAAVYALTHLRPVSQQYS